MSNSIGEKFQITSFGTSHGPAVGAVVDGCPANLQLTAEDIQKELDKRKPGTSSVTTPRKEDDEVFILSGIFEGKTDGTPITGVVFNKNQHSKDYSMLKNTPRPSHGDYGWMAKYGNYDYNGGGRGSGRVTIGHVIGGAIAKKLLKTQNIEIISHVTQIGDIKAEAQDFNSIKENIEKIKETYNPKEYYQNDNRIKRCLDALIDGTLSDGGTGVFKELYDAILEGASWHKPDHYYLLLDFADFLETKIKLNLDCTDRLAFAKKQWLNMCSAGEFSSDRTIKEYAKDIWKIKS